MAVGVLRQAGHALDVGASIAALLEHDERTNARVKTKLQPLPSPSYPRPLPLQLGSSMRLQRVTGEIIDNYW